MERLGLIRNTPIYLIEDIKQLRNNDEYYVLHNKVYKGKEVVGIYRPDKDEVVWLDMEEQYETCRYNN